MPLDGIWSVKLERTPARTRGFVTLPGTLESNGIGDPAVFPAANGPARPLSFAGPAVFERTVSIPDKWAGKSLRLFLELVHGRSQVWVDDKPAEGSGRSLAVPHQYDLTSLLTPGDHVLRLLVDNTLAIPLSPAAAGGAANHNWNGVLGRCELRVADPVSLRHVAVTPDIRKLTAVAKITVENRTGAIVSGTLAIKAATCSSPQKHAPPGLSLPVVLNPGVNALEAVLPMGDRVQFWDEFIPAVYRMTLDLTCTGPDQRRLRDTAVVEFGMREISRKGTQFHLNGRAILLRGTHHRGLFPDDARNPAEPAGWLKFFKAARAHGFNLVRFPAWCPPEAAFAAADITGVYLMPESPVLGDCAGRPELLSFAWKEAERILHDFGDHPSFLFFSIGDGLTGKPESVLDLIRHLKNRDATKLYAAGTDAEWTRAGCSLDPAAADFAAAATLVTVPGAPACSLRRTGPGEPASTEPDHAAAVRALPVPFIATGLGRLAAHPGLHTREKYTGRLRPAHLEKLRERLLEQGIADRAADWAAASGQLAILLAKEEIEAAIRTPGLGGFLFSDLEDAPGPDGLATCGFLDEFGDSKGIITADRVRRFCSPIVALARFPRWVWTTNETLRARIEVAHYGEEGGLDISVNWKFRVDGTVLASGTFPSLDVAQGRLITVGAISVPLAVCDAPAKGTLSVEVRGAEAENRWDLWIYPDPARQADPALPEDLTVTRAWTPEARNRLLAGGRVVLIPGPDVKLANAIPGRFLPPDDTAADPAGGADWPTLGLWCDVSHPALDHFPTDASAGWQWRDLAERSRAVSLDFLPPSFRAVVEIIDNPTRCQRLACLFEAQVGPGRLLFCSVDLETAMASRPAARQLRHSLLAYAAGDSFAPAQTIPVTAVDALFQAG